MTHLSTQKFVVADPRTFEGDPYEVAERAARQSAALARILKQTVLDAGVMIRNADLQRQLAFSDECNAEVFEAGPQGRKLRELVAQAEEIERTLTTLAKAAAYNPKAKVGRDD